MIGTITLNPCIDRTVEIRNFVFGGMNRTVSDRKDVSGKGVNVALALKQNGVPVRVGGFLYHEGAGFFCSELLKKGLEYQGVEVEGALRENVKIWDSAQGVTTEINQAGGFIPQAKQQEFLVFFRKFVQGLEYVILSGSAPQGVERNIYRVLMNIAHEENVECVLDAEGPLLAEGLKEHPLFIKPNLHEFQMTFGFQDTTVSSIVGKARSLIREGMCTYICVTLGKDGALLVDKDKAYFCPPLPDEVKSTQGAGDSVVAGICMALLKGMEPDEMLRHGIAMAQGTLSLEGSMICRAEDFARCYPRITVKEVS